ncbi:hypothetical protein [Nocardia alni]|uniref:hypothetical protein n=1 Tax=Nocardia alni TaxID=2815723 RepID=UPI001C23EA9C|nr:hypothetical protein [Nocardia alni]
MQESTIRTWAAVTSSPTGTKQGLRQRSTDVGRDPAVARRGLTAAARGLAVIAALVPPLTLGCDRAVADPIVPPPSSISSGSASMTNGGSGSAAPASSSALSLGPAASAPELSQISVLPAAAPVATAVPRPAPKAVGPASADSGTTLGHMLGLQTGSVATACAGSAVAGSAGIVLGLLTGSGLVGPGTVGVGSSGSSLGSVAVGSALTGSAVLTCLLLLPGIPPPAPELPLRIPLFAPPGPRSPIPARAPARPPAPRIPPVPARIIPQSEPIAEPEPPASPVAWNVLELITVLVVSVIASFRARSSGGGTRARL